jgi:hypothetical protein
MRLSDFEIVLDTADNDPNGTNLVTGSINTTAVTVAPVQGLGFSIGTLRQGKDDPNGSDTSYGNYNVMRKQPAIFRGKLTFSALISAETEPDNLNTESYVSADVIKLVRKK